MVNIDISIIIVNYNVKHFLDQCLRSVQAASQSLNIETLVVDNDSVDGSVAYVEEHFPHIHLIANKDNVGFATANNQAIRIARGKYILLLNPDTIIEEQTLSKCFQFMEKRKDCGALGVKMIDGEGKFLPESKRGFPTPKASLMRLTGLSKFFPKSRFFNSYNLGYLSEDETHDIDVLCGAFMLMPKKVLEEVGLLDEQFFMYGEDIDLSYRIQKGGYTICYYPETTIVHFKGESTKKSSIKYYRTFYNAMAIFAKKHFGGKGFNPFLLLINMAIFMIGTANYLWRTIGSLLFPILEFASFLGILTLVEFLWAKFYYKDIHYYDEVNTFSVYLLYSLIWVASLWISGAYRKLGNIKRLIGGIAGGSIVVLILYALIDNELRHSRAIIILSAFSALFISLFLRRLHHYIFRSSDPQKSETKRVVLVGTEEDESHVHEILNASDSGHEFIGVLSPKDEAKNNQAFIQSLSKIEDVVDVYKVDEVFFSTNAVPLEEIMKWMTILGSKVNIKMISRDVQSIIGSHDRNTKGDLYTIELKYNINLNYNRFLKWILDKSLALLLFILVPFILLYSMKLTVFRSIFQVVFKGKSFVGYYQKDSGLVNLPPLSPGLVPPAEMALEHKLTIEEIHRINFYYARDFKILRDLEIILLNINGIIQ